MERKMSSEIVTQVEGLRQELANLKVEVSRRMKRPERTVILIDNTNLNYTVKKVDTTGQYRLCYLKLTDLLAGDRLLRQTRIYYSDFDWKTPLEDEERVKRQDREGFYHWLRWQGFYLKACSLVERDGAPKEKGLDACIIKDMERICSKDICDTLILVAGDLDYRDTVAEVQRDYCVRVEVAFFSEYAAKQLQIAATKFIDLSKFKESLRRQPTPFQVQA
jgi:uncharacterized LabA/DUF88 family protein